MNIEFRGDFLERLRRVNKSAFLNRCIGQVGVIAVNFSKERFVQKNWADRNRETWAPRKRPARGSILVRSARLKRSIRKIAQGSYYVYIGTDVPYAQIHNEGGNINKTVNVKAFTRRTSPRRTRNSRGRNEGGGSTQNVKAHTRRMNIRMPKRQFLGESALLNRRIERFLSKELDKEISRNGA
ncbi:phage virion morphogenesis protein [Chryseobacterium sp.]|uniref:phage virion morphogenesis protein n=1 Tax=Chryseobacterium sp. TaxID=1871047 RepID=UPI002FC6824C